jgi:putative transcriptional regulator
MKKKRIKIDLSDPNSIPAGEVDFARVDATTEEDIAMQIAIDDAEAMLDAAKHARRVRKRLGLSQAELSRRINVSLETIRNWEQGKRSPTGAAKTLLRILDRAPEVALEILN